MKKQRPSNAFVWWSGGALVLFCIAIFTLPFILERSYSAEGAEATSTAATVESKPAFNVTHKATPEPLKALYMTACVASTPSWRESLKKFIEDTEINSIVVDIKDYTGTVSYQKDANCYVKDMMEFIGELHDADIYVIGRVTVFQDPHYAALHPELAIRSLSTGGVWKDKKGLAFIDVGAKPYWDYIIDIAKESYAMGFDEINFDYVRYPSDGNLKDMNTTWTPHQTSAEVGTGQAVSTTSSRLMTKPEVVESFFSYLHDQLLGTGMKTSADLFGLVTLASDDLGIGQELERALPYFDYIYPMVYPSHFAQNTGGFGDPSTHPYEIIKYSMSSGVAREEAYNIAHGLGTSTPSKLRPWIQDFDLGAQYNAPEIRAQMQATYDIGLTSWLSWDASNKYTRDAYLPQ